METELRCHVERKGMQYGQLPISCIDSASALRASKQTI